MHRGWYLVESSKDRYMAEDMIAVVEVVEPVGRRKTGLRV